MADPEVKVETPEAAVAEPEKEVVEEAEREVVEEAPKEAAKEEEVKEKKEDVVVEEDAKATPARPEFSLKPTIIIIVCAIIGLATGIGLADGRGSDEAISWIKLPGDLFLRALKTIVLPLVFVNIILAVIDMLRAGKASAVGWRTIILYTFTTLMASIEGLIFVLIFQGFFSDKGDTNTVKVPNVLLQCPGSEDFMSVVGDVVAGVQQVSCVAKPDVEFKDLDDAFKFELDNSNGFINEAGGGVQNDISFSQTLQDGIFRKLIADNIVNEFIKGNFVGIIVFAIIFGVASQSLKRQSAILVELLEELNRIFLKIIDWVIFITPLAVASLIAGNLGDQEDLKGTFADIGFLIASTILAMAFHFCVTYPLLFLFFVRKSPLGYMRYIIPAQIFAFASASSAATLPISLDCVASSGEVPSSVGNFVLSMGATLNMDGGGIYFPTAIVFLALSEGLGDQLNAAAYFLIILLSTIGSAGTAPVPSASLVLIITAYNTVFDTSGTPAAFGLILAVDWLMDRFRTTLNVTGDMLMARIIAASATRTTFGEKQNKQTMAFIPPYYKVSLL